MIIDPRPPAARPAHAALDPAASDAALLMRRMGDAIGDLALAVDGLQASLGPTIAAAAVRDAGLSSEAQKLDLVSQSLRGLVDLLAAVERRRIGREPLDFDRLAGELKLKCLADRLSGTTPQPADGTDAEWF